MHGWGYGRNDVDNAQRKRNEAGDILANNFFLSAKSDQPASQWKPELKQPVQYRNG